MGLPPILCLSISSILMNGAYTQVKCMTAALGLNPSHDYSDQSHYNQWGILPGKLECSLRPQPYACLLRNGLTPT